MGCEQGEKDNEAMPSLQKRRFLTNKRMESRHTRMGLLPVCRERGENCEYRKGTEKAESKGGSRREM